MGGFHGGSGVKNLPANAGDAGSIPGLGRCLEKEMATHSSILACEISWTGEPGQLQSMGSQSQTQLKWLSMHAQLIYNVVLTSIGQQSDSVIHMCVHARSLQLYLTLCDPVECSPPGSSVHGFLQARVLEWVAMTSSRGPSPPRD